MNPDDPPDDPDDPRVKDLDPATIAQLASWFELPSFASLDDVPPPPAETEAQKIQAHRQEVLAQIDPAMIDVAERHRRGAARLDKVRAPQRPWDGHRITVFDDRALPPPFDPYDAPEVEVPAALLRDLKICTPQAFLRDLYRPEKEFWVQMRSPWDDEDPDAQAAPRDPMAPVREVLRQSYRPPAVPRATRSMAASTADLKALLARPWQESKRAPARAREAELLRKLEGGGAVSRGPEGAP
jgi:hypothetical protein